MKYKIDKDHPVFKIIHHSLIVILIGFFPINYGHEFGHIAICVANGNVPLGPFVGLRTFSVLCLGEITNPFLLNVMGGVVGFTLAFSPLLVKRIRKNKGIVIGLLFFAIPQFGMGLGEGFFNGWYRYDPSSELTYLSMGFATLVIGIFLTQRNLKILNSSFKTSIMNSI